MIRKTFLQIILIFAAASALGQERIWTKQTGISAVILFEKEINPLATFFSVNESLSRDYYPLADKYQVAKPVIVQRPPVDYLPVYAEYFYTPGDSILRLVSYDWEKDRYGKRICKWIGVDNVALVITPPNSDICYIPAGAVASDSVWQGV